MVNFTYDDPDQGSNTCSAQQAAADNAAALGMFASAMYHDGNGFCFYPRLAHDGVIGAISLQPVGDDYLRGRSPWLWSYQMDTDREEQAIGAWACRRLADQPAAHASGLDGETPPRALSSLPRKFGVIIEPQYKDDPTTTSALESQLKTCGHPAAVVGGRTGVACNDCGGASGDTQVILNMKDAGVTSIVCLCWVGAAGQYMRDAESQSYFPEWLLSDYLSGDVYYGMVLTTATPDQLQHAFGLTFQPRQVACDDVAPGRRPLLSGGVRQRRRLRTPSRRTLFRVWVREGEEPVARPLSPGVFGQLPGANFCGNCAMIPELSMSAIERISRWTRS